MDSVLIKTKKSFTPVIIILILTILDIWFVNEATYLDFNEQEATYN